MTTHLKVDYDGEIPDDLEQRLQMLVICCGFRIRHYWIRKTRRGFHLGVGLSRRPTPLRVIAAQSILGSDWRREAFNLAKWRKRHAAASPEAKFWNVLFTRKVVADG